MQVWTGWLIKEWTLTIKRAKDCKIMTLHLSNMAKTAYRHLVLYARSKAINLTKNL